MDLRVFVLKSVWFCCNEATAGGSSQVQQRQVRQCVQTRKFYVPRFGRWLVLMGYVGICDKFDKGSLLICILCYVRSLVLYVTVGFVTFIFVFRILYLSLLRM